MIDDSAIWAVIVGLGVGTFLIRYSFLGIFGARQMPGWLLRHLKYTGVAVFPALFTPLLLWPEATGGQIDPIRLIAGGAAFVAGLRISVNAAILVGMGTLYAMKFLSAAL